MIARRHRSWSIAAALATGAAVGVLPVDPAVAQSASPTAVTSLPARKVVPQRRAPAPIPADDDDMPAPAPMDATADDPDADPNAEPQDGDDPRLAARRRNADGEPQVDAPPRDGVIDIGEPVPSIRDGEPQVGGDARLRADIDAFDKPPAGYDAVAFQIELDPILDRRPARLARFEPYDPLGIRKGSWIIFPEIESGIGWISNLFRSPARESSAFFDVRPTIRAVTNWRVHAIELKATGFATQFPGNTSENDRAYAVEARGRYDFTKRTSIEALVSHQLDQEGRSARDAIDSARERTDVFTNRAAVTFNHRFNRLSIQLRGSLTEQDYQPVATLAGSVLANDEKDVVVGETAARVTWEFKPTLFGFTEVAHNDRHHRTAPADGISRDSSGNRVRAGIAFGNAGKTWRGEVAAGYGQQRPDDERLSSVQGVILDANLGWRINELTSLLFTAKTDFNDSTTVGQSGSLSRQYGIEARHAFRRHLIGTAAIQHTLTDYKGLDLTERETTGTLGVEYFLNRNVILNGRYQHVVFQSSAPAADYDVDIVRFGVKVRQ